MKANPRLWLFAPRFCGVSEVWMYRQANGLHGFDVTAVSGRIENQDNFPPENFNVLATPPLPENWYRSPLLRFQNYLRNFNRDFFKGTVVESKWLDQQLTGSQRPDLILCHYGTSLHKIAKHAIHHNIPVVGHFNGHDLSYSLNSPRYVKQLRKLAPRLAGCVVVADYMRDALIGVGVSPDRIVKIPYGVSCDEFTPTQGLANDPCRFLHLGNFVEKKRPDITLQAFAECHRQVPNSELVMIGDGPLMDECKRIVASENLDDCVHLLGKQLRERVREELLKASVFVQHSVTSSLGDREGWPVAIGEACGSGLPVISTRHASIPEQIDDGQTGLLVDEKDTAGMAAAMIKLAESTDLRVSMGNASRDKALTFDLSKQLGELQDYLMSHVR